MTSPALKTLSPAPSSTASRAALRIGRTLLWLGGALLAVMAVGYLVNGPEGRFLEQEAVYLSRRSVLLMHIGGSLVALLLLPVQASARIRARFPQVHRVAGRVSVLAIVSGGSAGIALASTAYGGQATHVGFALLGVVWVVSTLAGVVSAVRGDYGWHQRLMLVSMACTLGAVTLRLQIGLAQLANVWGADWEFVEIYRTVAWSSWVPNVLVALWLGWRRTTRAT